MAKRFLLVNPYYPISETPSPPLGLAFLAGALEAAGHEVEILDLVVFPYSKEKLKQVLGRFAPHFVGFTAVTMNVENALSVLRDAKAVSPDILTIMGGPHVTFCAEKIMQATKRCNGPDTAANLIALLAETRQPVLRKEGAPITLENFDDLHG